MRSELIERLGAHLEDNDLAGLSGWSYHIVIDDESWALRPMEGRYQLDQIDAPELGEPLCKLTLTSASLETLIGNPKSAMLLIMKREIVVANPLGAMKLATTLKQIL